MNISCFNQVSPESEKGGFKDSISVSLKETCTDRQKADGMQIILHTVY